MGQLASSSSPMSRPAGYLLVGISSAVADRDVVARYLSVIAPIGSDRSVVSINDGRRLISDYFSGREVGNMSLTINGYKVVLAVRVECDILLHQHLIIVVFILK